MSMDPEASLPLPDPDQEAALIAELREDAEIATRCVGWISASDDPKPRVDEHLSWRAAKVIADLRARATAAEAERDKAQKMLGVYEEQHEDTSELVRFMSGQIKELKAEAEALREALIGLDQRIWVDPQVIDRAGEWRDYIRAALIQPATPANSEEATR